MNKTCADDLSRLTKTVFCRDGSSFFGNDLIDIGFNDFFDLVVVLIRADVDMQVT